MNVFLKAAENFQGNVRMLKRSCDVLLPYPLIKRRPAHRIEFTRLCIDHIAKNIDVLWNQRVVADRINRLAHGLFDRIKAGEPFFKINAAVFHQIDGFLRDAALFHVMDHHLAVDVLDTTVCMADDHDISRRAQ